MADVTPAPLATIVGIGAISPLGGNARDFWRGLFAPAAGPQPDALMGTSSVLPVGDTMPRRAYRLACGSLDGGSTSVATLSRFDRMALAAIKEALADAHWEGEFAAHATLGLMLGTAAGDVEAAEAASGDACFAAHYGYRLLDRLDSLPLPSVSGPVMAVTSACAAGLQALTLAGEHIASGLADAVCVVGVDVLSRVTQAVFHRMAALDPERCRPFDRNRAGTLFGEGAAALLLVSPALAGRFAHRYCDVLSYGSSCDAHHPTSPQPQGRDVRLAVHRALDRAGVAAAEVRLVLPHGTGTPLNDAIEGAVLADLLNASSGGTPNDVPVVPIKGHIGHCAGASGCFAVVAAALALSSREAPATVCAESVDPAIALRFPAASTNVTARDDAGRVCALVNAYAFGGANASVVLGASR